MKNVLYTFLFLFVVSCGVQKKIAVDPYVGTYNITIFQVDGFGDIPLQMAISKNESGYTSTLTDPAGNTTIDVSSTTLNEKEFSIEAYSMGYDIYLDINIDQDKVSGVMMDMFDIEGTRSKQ